MRSSLVSERRNPETRLNERHEIHSFEEEEEKNARNEEDEPGRETSKWEIMCKIHRIETPSPPKKETYKIHANASAKDGL